MTSTLTGVLTLRCVFCSPLCYIHQDLIESCGLHEDGCRGVNILRFRYRFDDPANPVFVVVQDWLPEWCDLEEAECRVRDALPRRSDGPAWRVWRGAYLPLSDSERLELLQPPWPNLQKARLARANFRGASLAGADLSFAGLRDADLRGADLRGATLRWADLSAARWDDGDPPRGWLCVDGRLQVDDAAELHFVPGVVSEGVAKLVEMGFQVG